MGVFIHYASHLAITRRRNLFEQRICMVTAGVYYVLGTLPICFWMSCFDAGTGAVKSKEAGFFVVLLTTTILELLFMIALRFVWKEDFAQQPALGNEHLCFAVASILVCFGLALYGTIVTYDDNAMLIDSDAHFISGCGAIKVLADNVSEVVAASPETINPASGACIPENGKCGVTESMVYAALACSTVTLVSCALAGAKLEGSRSAADGEGVAKIFPRGVDATSLSNFLLHGVLNAVFWIKCVSSEESQEQAYFIWLLIVSCVTVLAQVAYATLVLKGPTAGTCALLTLAIGWITFAAVGVHITSTEDTQWLGVCRLDAGASGTVVGSRDEIVANSFQESFKEDAVDRQNSIIYGKCLINDGCSSIESTAYGTVGVLALILLIWLTCLRGCGVIAFPKSFDAVTTSLWGAHTVLFLSFWTACKISDSSVEKAFWLTLLIWSVVLLCLLVVHGVNKRLTDFAMKVQVIVALLFVGLAAIMVHITHTNNEPILAGCTTYERCHWWDAGLSPNLACEQYWFRLDLDACSKARCGGHGICVGFEYTGGCVCSPSFSGRFCTESSVVNTNRAEVSIIFGLEGTVEETATANTYSNNNDDKNIDPIYYTGRATQQPTSIVALECVAFM
jgi:hypothetical protein